MSLEYLETLAVLAWASGLEAYAQYDSQIEDQRHVLLDVLHRLMQPDCLQQQVLQTQRHSQQEWLLKTLDVQQVEGALLLLECSKEGLETLVLCEACVMLATPLKMELAGPQGHLLLLAGVV